MEKTQKLQTIQQFSLYSNEASQIKPSKRESMRKRVSQQKSIEDFLKTISFDKSIQMQGSDNQYRVKKQKMCFQLTNLMDLSNNSLLTKCQSDPFLTKGLKFMGKSLNQNKVQTKKIEDLKKNYVNLSKICYRDHKQIQNAKKQLLLKKVTNTLEKQNMKS